MLQAKRLFEKCFWLLLIANPFFDIINGIWTYLSCGGDGGMLSSLDIAESTGVRFSLIIRMIFLLIMVAYIFVCRNRKAVLVFAAIAATWFLTVLYEVLRGVEFSFLADLQYIVRFCYCLLVLIIYSMLFRQSPNAAALKSRVDKTLCFSALVLSLGILVPYLFGVGFYTYADPLGYRGCRGFFYAGNDITVVLMLLLPLLLSHWLEQKSLRGNYLAWLQAGTASLCLVSLLIIGTKTAFLAVGITLLVVLVYSLCSLFFGKTAHYLIRSLIILAIPCLLLLILLLAAETSPFETIMGSFTATDKYFDIAGPETVIFSGRTSTLKSVFNTLKETLPWSAVVGVGRGSQTRLIEMDLVEVVFYYGLLGAASMLWLYIRQGFCIVRDLIRSFSLSSLSCFISLGLGVGFLTMAGHTLFSVTAGFYFSFVIVYSRSFCSDSGLSSQIL